MFEKVNRESLLIIQELANDIWPQVYNDLLTEEQIAFMLEMMYSLDTLQRDWDRGVIYVILKQDNEPVGFFGIEPNVPQNKTLRLHKLYLKKAFHGQGLGKAMLNEIERFARELNLIKVNLNVNRQNAAVNVYKRQGYEILFSEDIAIGNGFLMEDYQMEKVLD